MCERTLERYLALFIEDELAARINDALTEALVKKLDLAVDQQRLDSTHVFSNMASFGRTRLMGVAIKRFLTQVKRHQAADYEALPQELRERYAPAQSKLFAAKGQSVEELRVFDHPYYAITDSDGKFEIKLAPTGKFSLFIHHPANGWLNGENGRNGMALDIGPGELDMGEIKMKVNE